ncbi:hypothetical protein [Streptomyces sp. DW26H14]|uniref:hypothetical protein n=1 Tax=Streptomyces sp. DW26H14 TaxID=3435395 RepID=UPI00403D6BE4
MGSTQQPQEPGDGTTHHDPEVTAAPAPGRRRRRTPLVAASVAAVLVVAGGGAYLAAGSGGGPDAKPPLRIGPAYDAVGSGGPAYERVDPGGPVASTTPSPSSVTGIAPGEPAPSGLVYRARGPLPEGPDSARVYDADADVTAARVAALAKALGLSGAPHTDGQFWQVGTVTDTAAPLLRVQKKAPGTWTFTRSAVSPGTSCAKGASCPSTATGPDPDPGGPVHRAGGAVSEAAAKRAAAPVLAAVGQRGAHVDAARLLGAERMVNADPVVAGLPTYGWTTGLQVGADGRIAGGSGQLTVPAAGTSYPVTGAAQALKALNSAASGATGAGGCTPRVPLAGGPVTGAEPAPSATCASRSPADERTVPVGSAAFGLAARTVDGRPALVPSWLFTADPGGGTPAYRVTQPAVAPEYLRPTLPPHGMRPGGGAGSGASTPPAPGASPSGTAGGMDQASLSYTTHGRDLTVRFWGGVCGTYGLRADESGSAVRVLVRQPAREPGRMCEALAKRLTKTVTLKRPLGDRVVLSATTGAKVPHSAS